MRRWIVACFLAVACHPGSAPPKPVEAPRPPRGRPERGGAAVGLPPPPERHYVRGAATVAVVEDAGPFRGASVSPDGLLVALLADDRPTIVFYDIDRERMVGSAAQGTGQALRAAWFGDDLLIVETSDGASAFDGTRGAPIGHVPEGIASVVRTPEGPATLKRAQDEPTQLVLFADPRRVLAEVAVEGYVRGVVDLGAGAFAYASPAGLFAFSADGTPRWAHRGVKFERVEVIGDPPQTVHLMGSDRWVVLSATDGRELASMAATAAVPTAWGGFFAHRRQVKKFHLEAGTIAPVPIDPATIEGVLLDFGAVSPRGRFLAVGSHGGANILYDFAARTTTRLAHGSVVPAWAPNDAPRVAVGRVGVFDMRGGAIGAEPLIRFNTGVAPPQIKPVAPAAFVARCSPGAITSLGAATATALAPTMSVSGGSDVSEIVSVDGAYRVHWAESSITVERVADGSERTLDGGGPVLHVAFHPNGQSLVSAAHFVGVGNAHIGDPQASVRVFDLKSGALRRALSADDFRFSPSGRRLLVYTHSETALYDAHSLRRLRAWPGLDTQVWLDPTDRFAWIDVRPWAFGPLETTESYVEALGSGARIVDFAAHEGRFAFDAAGTRLAFAEEAFPSGPSHRIAVHALPSGKELARIQVDEPILELAFLDGDAVLSIATPVGLVLHRLADGKQLWLHAGPEGDSCRLFAHDGAGHFQGEPGGRLAFRYGDDLRSATLSVNGPERDAQRDDRLLERLFAPAP